MVRTIPEELKNKIYAIRPEQYEASDKGNGRLFADVYHDILRYNATAKQWYYFDGRCWKLDTGGMIAETKAKELVDALQIYSVSIENDNIRAEYMKYVARMGSRRVRNIMIEDSRDYYFITNDDLDKDLYLLNCENGVLNLKTFKFMKHSADFLITKLAPVKYDPRASSEVWECFIKEVLQDDTEKIKYLQKILGYSLTGGTNEESCYLLYGATTRNGKSTCVETFAYMLGDFALTMKPETLAQKTNSDSRQASGDIARLAGCRFLNASEPPKKMIFDAALLKTLLGRDTITARHLHQSEFQFKPIFKLFINTNHLPVITDNTLFSSGRLNVITFDRHFSEEEQDKDLKDKLVTTENLSGLLNWCIEGLKKYYAEGAIPPKSVVAATKDYEASSDKVGIFISECLEKSQQNSSVKEVYDKYSEWCSDNGFGIENKSNFTAELKSKGLLGAGKVNGISYKTMVKGYIIAQFTTPNRDTYIPFSD